MGAKQHKLIFDLKNRKLTLDLKEDVYLTIEFRSGSAWFYLGFLVLLFKEMQKRKDLGYYVPIDEVANQLMLLQYISPRRRDHSLDKESLYRKVYQAWTKRLPYLHDAKKSYQVYKKQKFEYRKIKLTDEEITTITRLFFVEGALANARYRIGLIELGIKFDEVKVDESEWEEFLEECKTGSEGNKKKKKEILAEKAPNYEKKWKELCLKMKDLKNSLVFGKFPLEKIFVEPQLNDKPAFRFLDKVLKEKRILVILNEFGMGKSSLCKKYASMLADRYLADPSGKERIPLFIDLEKFFTSDHATDKDLLKSYIEKKHKFLPDEDFLSSTNFCFIADAFDEADKYEENEIKNNFRKLMELSSYGDSRIIITSRPGVFSHLTETAKRQVLQRKDVTYTAIQDFSPEEINKWFENWHEISRKRISYSDIEAKGLEELARNPLLLYMIADVYDELMEKEKYKRAEVYYRFIRKTIKGKFEEDERADSYAGFCFDGEEEYKEVLQEMAYHIFRTGKPMKFTELANILESKFNKGEDKKDAAKSAIVCHFFREIEPGAYNFAHQTFMEFLNAMRVLEILLELVKDKKGKQNHLQAKFRLCGRLVNQTIIDLLKELIDLTREQKRLPDKDIKSLCSLLQEWYTCDDLLLTAPKSSRVSNTDYMSLPRNCDKSLNLRVLSLVVFVYLSSLLEKDPKVETKIFSLADFLSSCQPQGRLWILLVDNLSFADLRQADLSNAFLAGANLRGANLERADLTRANLEDAVLRRANLEGTNFEDANLVEATLTEANLSWGCLSGADLKAAHLEGVDLQGANLQNADLTGAYLTGADITRAKFRRACLADVECSQIIGWDTIVDFDGVDLTYVKGLSEKQIRYALKRGAVRGTMPF